jgi:endonuclease YncB( thermonuclease family)
VKRIIFRLILSLLIAFVIGCSSEPLSGPTSFEAAHPLSTVARVIDGDTIVVEGIGTSG